MGNDDARDLAWLELYQASTSLRAELSRRLEAEADMTVLEQDVLWYLSNAVDRRLTMSELAGRLLLSRSGGTRLVDRPERRCWVRRETSSDNRRVTYAVLEFGGFLGMGTKLFAVPLEALRLDAGNKRFILDADKDRLEDAPGFDKDHWPDFADPAFADRVHAYYGTTPH